MACKALKRVAYGTHVCLAWDLIYVHKCILKLVCLYFQFGVISDKCPMHYHVTHEITKVPDTPT